MRTAAVLEPTSADFALVAAVSAVTQGDPDGVAQLQAAAQLAPHRSGSRSWKQFLAF